MATKARRSNVRIVRDAYEAFNDGDMETIADVMADDIEWVEPAGSPYAGTFHGFEEVLEHVFTPSMEAVGDFEVSADRYVDCGESVVVLGTFHGKAPSTGEAFEIPFAHVCELEDGELASFTNYTDTATWAAVLGE